MQSALKPLTVYRSKTAAQAKKELRQYSAHRSPKPFNPFIDVKKKSSKKRTASLFKFFTNPESSIYWNSG